MPNCFKDWSQSSLCPICDNAGAHKFKLVQDFLETVTVVQLPNLPYSLDMSLYDIFLLTLLKKQSLHVN